MAFLNRVGNLLKKSASNHVKSQFSASNPSLLQAVRSMSSSKVFVGGLSYSTDEMSLKEAFSQFGEVVEARVIMDRDTGRSRGFGFVTYTSTEAASSAIQSFDGQDLHGRRIRVNYATEKSRGGGFGGGFGYGGGQGQGGNYRPGGYQGGGGYGGVGYGGGGSVQGGGGNYGAGENTFSGGGQTGFTSHFNDETTGGVSAEPLVERFGNGDSEGGDDALDKNDEDGNDEPGDYANTTNRS